MATAHPRKSEAIAATRGPRTGPVAKQSCVRVASASAAEDAEKLAQDRLPDYLKLVLRDDETGDIDVDDR